MAHMTWGHFRGNKFDGLETSGFWSGRLRVQLFGREIRVFGYQPIVRKPLYLPYSHSMVTYFKLLNSSPA